LKQFPALFVGIKEAANKTQRSSAHQPDCRKRNHLNVMDGPDGLLIHFAREVGASVIIRGLRAVSDFEYEIQMANMNARMEPNIETIFLMASDRHQFIASSLVKDIARLGGDTSQFVSKKVFERLKAKFKRS